MLKKWALTYIKNRDILLKRISKIEDKGEYFCVTNKDESHVVVVVREKIPDFSKVMARLKELQKIHSADKLSLVMYNTEHNLGHILKHWKPLVKFTTLTLVFANPKTNEKWAIVPSIHHKIADPESLKQGLCSLFASISTYASDSSGE